MTRLDFAREQSEHLLDRLLRVFDRAVLRIPPGRLDFRPTPANMTAREMAHHVYQIVLITYRGTELGRLAPADLDLLPFDEAAARTPGEIVAWGERVKEHARGVAVRLTEAQLERTVEYHFGLRATGWESLRLATEETLHHRGQLMVYLRLMGETPPRVGDYS